MTDLLTPSTDLELPLFLRRLSSDEYAPVPYTRRDRRVVDGIRIHLSQLADQSGRPVRALAGSRVGTAAGLLALNAEFGQRFYEVPPDATQDEEAAAAAFDGPELVIDVHTHFMAPHSQNAFPCDMLADLYKANMPDWWTEMDDLVAWDLAAYLQNIYLETETAVAVLTSGPGLDDWRNLFNDEMAATQALIDGLAGTGRLLIHSVVHANVKQEFDSMEEYRDTFHPSGWKVYTLGQLTPEGPIEGWFLDDDNGMAFLERARELSVKLVCAHKGVSWQVPNGSPRDIGPAAKAFPDLEFMVYHSGYELPSYGAADEGPYSEQTADQGVNRLITSVRGAGIGRGQNVYADLGTTWFSLIRRPDQAAHVLGKLIAELGEDNVVWGTDSIWYGAAQPLVDAFRSFQIPEGMCEAFGYAPLTPAVKEKILSLNGARLYGIDVPEMRKRVANDDLAWTKQLIKDYQANGFSSLR